MELRVPMEHLEDSLPAFLLLRGEARPSPRGGASAVPTAEGGIIFVGGRAGSADEAEEVAAAERASEPAHSPARWRDAT